MTENVNTKEKTFSVGDHVVFSKAYKDKFPHDEYIESKMLISSHTVFALDSAFNVQFSDGVSGIVYDWEIELDNS